MSRRFSDEPINLIRRIPTPEQLSAARPSKRSFGQALKDTGAAWLRRCAEVVATCAGSGHPAQETLRESRAADDAAAPIMDGEPSPKRAVAAQAGPTAAVQPEEVAELRAYILSQQHDIARLSAQLQELKSLVVSQQQVLVYRGKELEGAPTSMTGVASGPAKRSRALREKSYIKEKAVLRKDTQNPSLSL
jgi:hypothetical protein